jgi:ferredoxin
MVIGMCTFKQHGLTGFALDRCILSSCIGNCMTCMGVCLTNVIAAVTFQHNTNYSSSEENTGVLFYFCPALYKCC